MKIICIEQNTQQKDKPLFFLKPDSALLRNKHPFFYPDFTKDLRANISLILRLGRLGRSIHERFALRYIEAIGAGLDFTAYDLLENIRAQGLSWEPARCFDYSNPISSEWLPFDKFDKPHAFSFNLMLNGKNVIAVDSSTFPFSYAQIIAHVSNFITLKIGDFICINAPAPAIPLKVGDTLIACLEEKEMLKVVVK